VNDRSHRLRDGRLLAFSEWGEASGAPVLFLHGAYGSRLERHPDDTILSRLGVRLVTFDRPGFGRSEFQPGRTITAIAGDVAELADALAIERFAVAGWSAGSIFALACAHGLARRVLRVASIGSVAPFDRPGATAGWPLGARLLFGAARRAPALLALRLAWLERGGRRDPEAFLDRLWSHADASDRAVLARPEVRALLLADVAECFRQGIRGPAREEGLRARPWGFALAEVRVPVVLWHGRRDRNTPLAMAHHLAAALPCAELREVPDAGHCVAIDAWEAILRDLVEAGWGPGLRA